MSNIKKLLRHYSHYSIGEFFVMASGIISFPILTRLFSQSDYGQMSIVSLTLSLGTILATGGLAQSSVRYFEEFSQNKRDGSVDTFYSTLLLTAVFLPLVVIGIFIFASFTVLPRILDNATLLLLRFVAIMIFLRNLTKLMMSFYRVEQKIFLYNFIYVLQKYLALVLSIGFILFLWKNLYGFYLGQIIGESIILALALLIFLTSGRFKYFRFSKSFFIEVLKFGFPLVLLNGSFIIFNLGDRYIIQYFLGLRETGIYSVGYNLAGYIESIVLTPLNVAIAPLYMKLWVEKGKEETARFLSQTMKYYIMVAVLIIFGLSAISKEVLLILAGSKFEAAHTVIPLVITGVMLYGAYYLCASALFIAKKTLFISLLVLSAAVLNIILNIFAVPKYGIIGAAFTTALSYVFLVIFTKLASNKYINVKIPYRVILKCIVIGFVMYYFLINAGILAENRIFSLFYKVISGTFIYFALLIFSDKKLREFIGHLFNGKSLLSRFKYYKEKYFTGKVSIIKNSKFIKKYLGIKKLTKNSVIKEIEKIRNYKFYFDDNELEEILDAIYVEYKDSKDQTLEEADEILSNKFRIFGFSFVSSEKLDWHMDYRSRKRWPDAFYKDIDITNLSHSIGDIKYPWELNRHQYLLSLAKAYRYTKDEGYANACFCHIQDWIKDNPVYRGINWLSGLEIGLRLISWAWTLNLLKDSKSMSGDQYIEISKSILEQVMFIDNHLSIREYSNNHLIGEAASLCIVGITFSEFIDSKRWIKKGLSILEGELDKQFSEDGVHKEKAVSYHLFVVDFYTQVVLLCKKNNIVVSEKLLQRLEKMCDFILYSARPDRFASMIGDSDDGQVLKISSEDKKDLKQILSTAAVLFKRPDFKKVAEKFSEKSLWLLGKNGFEEFSNLNENFPQNTTFNFKEGGFSFMRSGWEKDSLYSFFDVGDQGFGEAGHGHADALSFEIYAFGKPLLVDPGTYTYNGGPEWRNYFRGTSAHNTVVVDDRDQAVPLMQDDPFGWKMKADAKLVELKQGKLFDFVCATHDGYKNLKQSIVHQRSFLFIKHKYWVMTDSFFGTGKHKFDTYFHFRPTKVIFDKENGLFRTQDDFANIAVIPLDIDKLQSEIVIGETTPAQGWVSNKYDEKIEAPVLKCSNIFEAPVRFDTVLFPFNSKELPKIKVIEVSVFDKNAKEALPLDSRCFKVEKGDKVEHILISKENNIKYFNGFRTDAKALFISKYKNDTINEIIILNGSFLEEKENNILRSDSVLSFLEIMYLNARIEINMSERAFLKLSGIFCNKALEIFANNKIIDFEEYPVSVSYD